MPAPSLTLNEIAQALKSAQGSEYTNLLKEQARLEKLLAIAERDRALRSQRKEIGRDRLDAQRAALDKQFHANEVAEARRVKEFRDKKIAQQGPTLKKDALKNAQDKANRERRNQIDPSKPPVKPQADKPTLDKDRKPKTSGGAQRALPKMPSPSNQRIGSVPFIPAVDGSRYNDATSRLLGGNTPDYYGDSPIAPALRVQRKVIYDIMNGIVRATPIASLINAIDAEFNRKKGSVAATDTSAVLKAGNTVTNEQLAALIQEMNKTIQVNNVAVEANMQMLKAIAAQNHRIEEGVKGTLVGVAGIPDIAATTASTQKKLGNANFTLQNQAAALTKQKLSGLDVAQLMQTSRLTEQKLPRLDQIYASLQVLPKNGIYRVDQTGIANVVKSKLDPSFQAIDGKLPKNGIFRVDQTGIANVVKSKLDPSFQAIDGKLPKNGIFRVDQTGIANVVKSKLDPSFQAIDFKLPKNGLFPVDLTPVTTPLNRVERKVNLLPSDIARKSDIANIKFPTLALPGCN
jgi:hypothetical protein